MHKIVLDVRHLHTSSSRVPPVKIMTNRIVRRPLAAAVRYLGMYFVFVFAGGGGGAAGGALYSRPAFSLEFEWNSFLQSNMYLRQLKLLK